MEPDFNRVIAALKHEEPDRVPLVEALITHEIQSQFLGRTVTEDDLASQVEFWTQAGYDYVPLTVGMMTPGKVTQESQISKTIRDVMLRDGINGEEQKSWNLEQTSWIHSERDFEAFPWDEVAKLDFDQFYEVQPLLPRGMKIVALSGKIFTLTWMLMGFENFGVNLMINPGFVERVFTQIGQIQLAALEKIKSIPNVAAVWAVDDLAFGSGPIIRPQALRDYVFPWYREMARQCHKEGLFFFFHSDGVLWDLMDDLIDLGIDALHPIDPTCMDINEVKRRVGHRICILGNISNEILMTGTPEEVEELVKSRIRDLAPGGGYCLGSGNSVPEWAKFENYMAMRDAGLKYGRYPIQIN
jgi:uroporphyrinogen decarboxylase